MLAPLPFEARPTWSGSHLRVTARYLWALLRRRHGGVGLVAALERSGDEAGGLHLLDEFLQIGRGGLAPPRRAHRLADLHEAAVHHPHVRMVLRIAGDRLLHPGRGLELLLDEQRDAVLAAHELVRLDTAGAVGVASAILAYPDAPPSPRVHSF